MSDRGFLISSANHCLPKIVNNKYQPAVFSLRDDDALVLWNHTGPEHQMSTLCTYNALESFGVILGPKLVGVHASTVHHNFRFYRELFFLEFVKKHSPDDLASGGVLQEVNEFNIVSESGTLLPWNEPFN